MAVACTKAPEEQANDQESLAVEDHDYDIPEAALSFSELILSMYFPVVLLWMRRAVFGTANILRSLVLGHLLRLVFDMAPEARALPSLLGAQKSDPHSWPPPALKLLAILTMVALTFHPDGLTWVLLGKARDTLFSLLRSVATCWKSAIRDYGILPTLGASVTLACLVLLILIVYRTIKPRTPKRPSETSEKKKKKRKGQPRKGGRIKGKGKSATPVAPPPLTKLEQPPLPTKPPAEPPLAAPSEEERHHTPLLQEEQKAELVDAAPPSLQKEKPLRDRRPSVSTVDTSAMSEVSVDDHSLESTSARFEPRDMPVEEPIVTPTRKLTKNTTRTSRKVNADHFGAHGRYNAPKPTAGASRWDALKPTSAPNRRRGANTKKSRTIPPPPGYSESFHSSAPRRSTRHKNQHKQFRNPGASTFSPVPPPPGLGQPGPSPSALSKSPAVTPTPLPQSFGDYFGSGRKKDESPYDLGSPISGRVLTPKADNFSSYHAEPSLFRVPVSPPLSPSNHSSTHNSSPGCSPRLSPQYVSYGFVKENPFATVNECVDLDAESRIEAELQELGGQMAGSILDF